MKAGSVEAHPNADRETYERALERGDLAICASEYETLARTWFEQAASGQVLLLRDEPWVYDCVPDDHPLTAPLEDLGDLAVAAVEGWDEAIAANRDLVAHVERVRSPERVGERTYDDLRRRVENKKRRYALEGGTAAAPNGDGGTLLPERPTLAELYDGETWAATNNPHLRSDRGYDHGFDRFSDSVPALLEDQSATLPREDDQSTTSARDGDRSTGLDSLRRVAADVLGWAFPGRDDADDADEPVLTPPPNGAAHYWQRSETRWPTGRVSSGRTSSIRTTSSNRSKSAIGGTEVTVHW